LGKSGVKTVANSLTLCCLRVLFFRFANPLKICFVGCENAPTLGTFRSATKSEYELRVTSSLFALAAFVSGRFVSCLRASAGFLVGKYERRKSFLNMLPKFHQVTVLGTMTTTSWMTLRCVNVTSSIVITIVSVAFWRHSVFAMRNDAKIQNGLDELRVTSRLIRFGIQDS
jgi:hypothetical protein